jgi:hypothetical protein
VTFVLFFMQPSDRFGVYHHNLMNEHNTGNNESMDQDPLWDLIRRDAVAHASVQNPSPWFATRTVAKAREIPQSHRILTAPSFLRRLLLPIPLAGLAALLVFALHLETKSSSGTFVSSEAEFEQHMEMLTSGDQGI